MENWVPAMLCLAFKVHRRRWQLINANSLPPADVFVHVLSHYVNWFHYFPSQSHSNRLWILFRMAKMSWAALVECHRQTFPIAAQSLPVVKVAHWKNASNFGIPASARYAGGVNALRFVQRIDSYSTRAYLAFCIRCVIAHLQRSTEHSIPIASLFASTKHCHPNGKWTHRRTRCIKMKI